MSHKTRELVLRLREGGPLITLRELAADRIEELEADGVRLKEAVAWLRAARDAYFEGNPHDGTEKSPEGHLYAAIERVLSAAASPSRGRGMTDGEIGREIHAVWLSPENRGKLIEEEWEVMGRRARELLK